MNGCSVLTWADWAGWIAYLVFMVFLVKWAYQSLTKSPLDRAVDQLSADAIDDIQDFLDSPIGSEAEVSQYLEARLGRLRKAIEVRASMEEGR